MISGDTAAVNEYGQIQCSCLDNEYPASNGPLSYKIDLVHDIVSHFLINNY